MTIVRQVAVEDCCCDGRNSLKQLISVEDAAAIIASTGCAIDRVEHVALEEASGRILAEPVFAKAEVPPFDNSAMDGFAVRSQDFVGEGPWFFPISGSVAAGHAFGAVLPEASAMQILTGAPIPEGADTVVPQESVVAVDGRVVFSARPKPGSHIRNRGEDLNSGQLVVPGNCKLGASEVAALAASGYVQIPVRGRIRAAILATGDELRGAGQSLAGAGIWDVNTPMISSALRAAGVEMVETVSVTDDKAAMADALYRLANACDLIVTTGGISVGDKDFVKLAFSDAGGRIVFSGVAMKPGKPVSFGTLGATRWLGLPGNPYAALVAWTLFGCPLVDVMAGVPQPSVPSRLAVTTTRLDHPTGRSEFRLAARAGYDGLGRLQLDCEPATHSARVSSLAGADGIVEIPQGVDKISADGLVRFFPF